MKIDVDNDDSCVKRKKEKETVIRIADEDLKNYNVKKFSDIIFDANNEVCIPVGEKGRSIAFDKIFDIKLYLPKNIKIKMHSDGDVLFLKNCPSVSIARGDKMTFSEPFILKKTNSLMGEYTLIKKEGTEPFVIEIKTSDSISIYDLGDLGFLGLLMIIMPPLSLEIKRIGLLLAGKMINLV